MPSPLLWHNPAARTYHASTKAQKNGDLAPFSKALLWNSQVPEWFMSCVFQAQISGLQELAFLVADYRKWQPRASVNLDGAQVSRKAIGLPAERDSA